jgi:hypothetical protein
VDREYSQIEELLWLYRQCVLINAQIGGPLSRVIRTLSRRRRTTESGPICDMGWIEIPQRSSHLPHRGVLFLSFGSTGGTGQ